MFLTNTNSGGKGVEFKNKSWMFLLSCTLFTREGGRAGCKMQNWVRQENFTKMQNWVGQENWLQDASANMLENHIQHFSFSCDRKWFFFVLLAVVCVIITKAVMITIATIMITITMIMTTITWYWWLRNARCQSLGGSYHHNNDSHDNNDNNSNNHDNNKTITWYWWLQNARCQSLCGELSS